MIIAKITSGLGNQLFQYALARHLSIKYKTPLYFDLGFYDFKNPANTARQFKLDHFTIKYKTLPTVAGIYWSKATKVFPNRSLSPLFTWIQEKQHHYDDLVLNQRAGCITLQGYWQSEKYFKDIAPILRKDLVFKSTPQAGFDAYEKAITASVTPVSVHIRRGDYVHHPEFSKTYGFVGLDYYRKAIEMMQKLYGNCVFFVFTDDKPWVEKHLAFIKNSVLVDNRGENSDLDDLHLMSLCKHNIIANSSYSWWGAWLNGNEEKLVIAPRVWYRNKPELNTKDMLPAEWLAL